MARRRYSAHPSESFDIKRIILVAVALVAVVGGTVLWMRRHNKPDPNNVYGVITMVSKHAMLPTNEEPALATVTDTSKLNTTFLKQASNGDKILIYEKNQKAIIYRPSTDRIIDIGPVNIGPANTTTQPKQN